MQAGFLFEESTEDFFNVTPEQVDAVAKLYPESDAGSSLYLGVRFFQPFNHGTTFSRLVMRPPAIFPIAPANGLTGSLYLGFQIHDFHTFASLIRAFRLSKRLSCTLSLLAKLRITSSSRPPLTIR